MILPLCLSIFLMTEDHWYAKTIEHRNMLLLWKKKKVNFTQFKKGSQTNQLSQQGLGLFWVSWPVDPYGVVSVFRSIHTTHSEGSKHTQIHKDSVSWGGCATMHSLRCHITQYVFVNVIIISSYLQSSKCYFQHCCWYLSLGFWEPSVVMLSCEL